MIFKVRTLRKRAKYRWWTIVRVVVPMCGVVGERQYRSLWPASGICFQTQSTPSEDRPYIAVATREGLLVNMHLGERWITFIFPSNAKRISLCRRGKKHQKRVEDRFFRLDGVGLQFLKDCRAILAGGAGIQSAKYPPKRWNQGYSKWPVWSTKVRGGIQWQADLKPSKKPISLSVAIHARVMRRDAA